MLTIFTLIVFVSFKVFSGVLLIFHFSYLGFCMVSSFAPSDESEEGMVPMPGNPAPVAGGEVLDASCLQTIHHGLSAECRCSKNGSNNVGHVLLAC